MLFSLSFFYNYPFYMYGEGLFVWFTSLLCFIDFHIDIIMTEDQLKSF